MIAQPIANEYEPVFHQMLMSCSDIEPAQKSEMSPAYVLNFMCQPEVGMGEKTHAGTCLNADQDTITYDINNGIITAWLYPIVNQARLKLVASYSQVYINDHDRQTIDSSFYSSLKHLSLLPVQECYVGLSRNKKTLDYTVSLGHGVVVKISRPYEEPSSIVAFTVIKDRCIVMIDCMPLEDVVRCLSETMMQI